MNDPAMLSEITRTSISSFQSSHAVRRAPCRNGRVSSASTRKRFPFSTAARITPERSSVSGSCESAGIAMREDRSGVRQQFLTEVSHPLVALDVFGLDRERFADQPIRQ